MTKFVADQRVVRGMMQLDMTLYPGRNGDEKSIIALVTDYVSADLTAFIKLLVDSFSEFNWIDTKCGYACSDHASWTAAGYSSCFPFETTFDDNNPYIHSSQDTLDHASFKHGIEFVKVALAYVVELASTDN